MSGWGWGGRGRGRGLAKEGAVHLVGLEVCDGGGVGAIGGGGHHHLSARGVRSLGCVCPSWECRYTLYTLHFLYPTSNSFFFGDCFFTK